jgi:hypothetical protein
MIFHRCLYGVEPLAVLLEVRKFSAENFDRFERVNPPLRLHDVLEKLGAAGKKRLVHIVGLLVYKHGNSDAGNTACA